MMTAMTAS